MDDSLPELGDLEREVMQLVWANGPVTAEAVRERLSRPFKESAFRTVLRRLEEKGYTTHTVDGRTYVYQAAEPASGGGKSRPADRRLVLQRLRRRGPGRHGGYGDARPASATYAGRPGCEGQRPRLRSKPKILKTEAKGRRRNAGDSGGVGAGRPALGGVVWAGLNLIRVRNPHVHMTCWAMVPLAPLHAAVDALGDGDRHRERAAGAGGRTFLACRQPVEQPVAGAAAGHAPGCAGHARRRPRPPSPPLNWLALATIVYALVAGLLLSRLAVGLYLTWRLARAAKPMREPWTADWSVRVSSVIAGPVTFGSTILLPPQCFDWDVRKRQAVLAHEGAHVANRDFYLLLLASFNRSGLWFSPFAWWHLTRLAELAEIISDATALEVVEDRLPTPRFA